MSEFLPAFCYLGCQNMAAPHNPPGDTRTETEERRLFEMKDLYLAG
jgi:hypothetical protein